LLTFWYINIKKIKGKECIHVTKNVREYRRGNKKGTFKRNCQQDEEKHKKKYVVDITIRKQTQTTYIRHKLSYKQLELKTTRTSFYVELVTDITTRMKIVYYAVLLISILNVYSTLLLFSVACIYTVGVTCRF